MPVSFIEDPRPRQSSRLEAGMAEQHESNGHAWARDVVARHEGALLRYARRLTGCSELAREAVQETLLRCWGEKKRHGNGHAAYLANWLFAVCRSRAIDALRTERQMTRVAELEDIEGLRESGIEGLGAGGATRRTAGGPAEVVETQDTAAEALRVLETLPLRQQEVLVLKFQGGLSYAEIAEVTGLSVSNVGFLMHAGLKALRQRLTSTDEVR